MFKSFNPKKILHIIRHGKALQDYRQISDIDRPLVEKGILNNITMATRLKKKNAIPELIISSPAARALHTAHIFARVWGYPSARIRVNDDLYMQGEDAILDALYALSDDIRSVAVVAHNPDLTYLADYFVRGMTDSLPTSGVVSVYFDTDQWNLIHHAAAKSDQINL